MSKSHLKVAYFAFSEEFPAPHAGYVHANSITKALAKIGVHVTVYARPSCSHLPADLYEGDRRIRYVKLPFLTKSHFISDLSFVLPSYLRICKDIEKFDLIHERFSPLNIWSASVLKDVDVLHILEVNSPFEEIENKVLKHLIRKGRRRQFEICDAIITQTETLREILEEITDKGIFVVPNGVDVERYGSENSSEDLRRRYAPESNILITYVGAFRKWHGVHRIPEIAREITARYENTTFLLVGGGPLYGKVKTLSRNLDNMILTGPVKNEKIPEIMASSDILIAPFEARNCPGSDGHGFWWSPLKLYEYMASGKPVVSYGFGEVKKIVKNCGLLAEPGDIKGFINLLSSLIEDENLRNTLGRMASETSKDYDWKYRAKETIKAYEKVLQMGSS